MARMTFHESYGGELPVKTLALIKAANVSPADYILMQFQYGDDWSQIDHAIQRHSSTGSFSSYHWAREFVW